MTDLDNLPPTTTAQEDRVVESQQRVNILWERTQSGIAFIVVLANMIVGTYRGLVPSEQEFPIVLSSALFLVIGFYFSRTNHSNIGGVGQKPNPIYEGR